MEKKEKIFQTILKVILFFLIFNFLYNIYYFIDYESRKAAGNERWRQVEEKIKEIERCCNDGRNS